MIRWLHWWILPNTYRRINTNPSQTLLKKKTEGKFSQLILWSQYYPDTKAKWRHHKKRKLQTNISYEHGCKNPQQNTRKPNPATYIKGYIVWGFPNDSVCKESACNAENTGDVG